MLDSDLVFFVGSKTGSQVTHSWQIPPPGRTVIQLDIDAGELGRNYVTRASLLGDAKMTLARLYALVDFSTAPRRVPWTQQVSAYVAQWREKFDPAMESNAEPIRPERICKVLNEVLPDDALVVADTGHAGMWTAAMLDLRRDRGSSEPRAHSVGDFQRRLEPSLQHPIVPSSCLPEMGGPTTT